MPVYICSELVGHGTHFLLAANTLSSSSSRFAVDWTTSLSTALFDWVSMRTLGLVIFASPSSWFLVANAHPDPLFDVARSVFWQAFLGVTSLLCVVYGAGERLVLLAHTSMVLLFAVREIYVGGAMDFEVSLAGG